MFWCCGVNFSYSDSDDQRREVASQRRSAAVRNVQVLEPNLLNVDRTDGINVLNHNRTCSPNTEMVVIMNDIASVNCKPSKSQTMHTLFPPDERNFELTPTAAKLTECSVCFDDLCNGNICALFYGSHRSCRHFFHTECVAKWSQSLSGQLTCPLCRCPYQKYESLPDVYALPDKFFDFIDFDGDGVLSRAEIFEVLRSTLPLSEKELEKIIVEEWKNWDEAKDDEISREEFFHAEKGLLSFVVKYCSRRNLVLEIPSIFEKPFEWFQYWDDDDNGSLSPQEVLRAIVKSFNISTDHDALQRTKELVTSLWKDFDSDPDGSITYDEFCSPDGLRDTIVANLVF